MSTPITETSHHDQAPAERPRRVVFYGPGRSGKTANILALARLLPGGEERVRTLKAGVDQGDRFEFLACEGSELGLDGAGRLHLLSVPGRYLSPRSRRTLLADVDGVVFVADSRRDRLDADILLLDELGSNLVDLGLTPPRVGIVLQYNRCDDIDALSAPRLDRALNLHGGPRISAVASRGEGVLETLRLLLEHMPLRRD
jgi:mutual gliding-motility protein MglA